MGATRGLLVLHNGQIHTFDARHPRTHAIALRNGMAWWRWMTLPWRSRSRPKPYATQGACVSFQALTIPTRTWSEKG
jgi:hypothetical protein